MDKNKDESRILQIEKEKTEIFQHMENPLICQPFMEDFAKRFSWSTNAIEGNTLSLEETIAVIDYDEVRSNHTYSEYTDAKNAYHAIQNMLIPFTKTVIDETWIEKANGYIRHMQGEYRETSVYIGNLSEAVYYPPDPQDVPALMKNWIREAFRRYDKREDLSEIVYVLLKSELESFERVRSLALKLSKDREKQKKEMKHLQNR